MITTLPTRCITAGLSLIFMRTGIVEIELFTGFGRQRVIA